jgi:hypothetical protein
MLEGRTARGGRAAGAAAALALLLGLLTPGPAVPADSGWEWDGIDRVVAVGDVHGRFDQLTAIVQSTGLTDQALRWTGGDDHLVLCGDLVDRGPDDRAVMDLARRLQKEAEKAGGRVHVILGNHEVMNLTRDFRYVRPEGWTAFAPDEDSGDRREAWKKAAKTFSAKGASEDEARAAFDEKYPAGYFARRQAFSRNGDYGSWLLDQPTVIKVNGVLFVHGGLTPRVAALGIEAINQRVRESIGTFLESADLLQRVMTIPGSFGELHGTAQQVLQLAEKGRPIDASLKRAAEILSEQAEALPFAPDGPMWYRGSSLDNERVERGRLDVVLEQLDARAILVGHTVTRTGRVSSRFQGQLIRADVGMGYGRQGHAVIFENGKVSTVDPVTRQASVAYAEPPYGEGWTGGSVNMPDAELEQFLERAVVVERTEISRAGLAAEVWEMEGEGLKVRGIFKDIEQEPPGPGRPESRRYQHEVAAYELDRMLDIGLVPPVVVREVDGRRGALRAVSETALDLVSLRGIQDIEGATPQETIKAVAEAYGLAVEELAEQVVRARVFDGLIGNLGRTDVDKLFIPAEGRVALVDQDEAFGLSTDVDPALLNPCRPLPADLRIYLMELSADGLKDDLGGYLTGPQIDAILQRRDRVLELCGAPETSS